MGCVIGFLRSPATHAPVGALSKKAAFGDVGVYGEFAVYCRQICFFAKWGASYLDLYVFMLSLPNWWNLRCKRERNPQIDGLIFQMVV
jgi:hypothetical protein